MRRHSICRPATAVVGAAVTVCAALWVAALCQGFSDVTLSLPLAVALAAVGAVLGVRMSANPIGWLLLGWAVLVSATLFAVLWTMQTVARHDPVTPVQRWLVMAVAVTWHPAFSLFVLVMLLFPAGRLLSRRWRWAAGAVIVHAVALAAAAALSPGSSLPVYAPGVRPPYTSPVESAATGTFGLLLGAILLSVLVGVVSLVVRWRRTTGDDRRQVTAFVLPTVIGLGGFVVSVVALGDGRLGFILLAVLPISLAVAISRYRLYALDKIVSRTVTYGLVTATVIGVYAGAVQLITLALPGNDALGIAAATLTAAALFTPLRRRVQHRVDRRFDRTRYDRERTIEQLRTRLRRDVDLTQVQHDLIDSVDHALHPTSTSVWMRPGLSQERCFRPDTLSGCSAGRVGV